MNAELKKLPQSMTHLGAGALNLHGRNLHLGGNQRRLMMLSVERETFLSS